MRIVVIGQDLRRTQAEVQAYLDCGILERGCAALHLVRRVIPEVPVRQWVCSLPRQLRYVLGYDRKLCAAVLGAFVTELSRSYTRRAKREHGLPSVSQLCAGAVTFVQRVDGACRLNVHAHTVALDGVYLRDAQQGELALAEPALSACYQAAASGQQLFGERAGRPALRLLLGPANQKAATKKTAPKLCAQVRGVNIHASAAVPGTDRARIERLCRYAARPPLAQDRLHELADGRVRLSLKAPWADGRACVAQRVALARLPKVRTHTARACHLAANAVPAARQHARGAKR